MHVLFYIDTVHKVHQKHSTSCAQRISFLHAFPFFLMKIINLLEVWDHWNYNCSLCSYR